MATKKKTTTKTSKTTASKRTSAKQKKENQELRDIIILRYYKGLTLQEIAGKMNLSYGVTKLRHREALGKLRDLI